MQWEDTVGFLFTEADLTQFAPADESETRWYQINRPTGPTAAACTSHGAPYSLSGCGTFCLTPTVTTGFTLVENNLDAAAGFDVVVSCAPGYAYSASGMPDDLGGPTAVPCSVHGTKYALLGTCEAAPDSCASFFTLTSGDPGYAWVGPPGYVNTCSPSGTEADLTIGSFFSAIGSCRITCATGYSGTPTSSVCTGGPGSPYILAGCSPVCESMHDGATGHYIGPEGYAVVNENSLGSGFDVDVDCAAGWSGVAAANTCTAAGPYMLSGCSPAQCTSRRGGASLPTRPSVYVAAHRPSGYVAAPVELFCAGDRRRRRPYSSLPTAHCPLPTTHYPLPQSTVTAHLCPLSAARCPLPTIHCYAGPSPWSHWHPQATRTSAVSSILCMAATSPAPAENIR